MWEKLVKQLSPLAVDFLEKGLPAAKNRVMPVMEAAKTAFGKDNPAVLKDVERGVWAAAQANMRKANPKMNVDNAALSTAYDYFYDSGWTTPLANEAREMGKKGLVPNIQKPVFTSKISEIQDQAKYHWWQDRLHEFTKSGNKEKAAEATAKLAELAPKISGQWGVKDLRFKKSIFGPATRGDLSVGMGRGWVEDHHAASVAIDGTIKPMRAAWRAATEGIKSMAQDSRFNRDMGKLWVETVPLQNRYYTIRKQLIDLETKIEKATASGNVAEAGKLADKRLAMKPELEATYTKLAEARYKAMAPYFDQPDVRIALWREPETKHWVDRYMTEADKKVAAYHDQMMQAFRARGKELGINMLDVETPYITHLVHKLSSFGGKSLSRTERDRLGGMIPAVLKFAHRTPGSMQFYPSVSASTEVYITSAARKFGMTEFLKRWQPIATGKLYKRWGNVQGALKQYIDQFAGPGLDEGVLDKAFRSATTWMYLSKVALSLSAARKHGQKALTLFMYDPVTFSRSLPQAVRGGAELIRGQNASPAARLLKQHQATRNFVESFSGITGNPDTWSRLVAAANAVGASPITMFEAAERGTATIMGITKASRMGLTLEDAQRAVYQLLLNHSFLGKSDRFLWLNKPIAQFLGIFAYTPMRITETTIKRALASIPKKNIIEAHGATMNYVLGLQRDAFGTPLTKTTAQIILGVGALSLAAKKYADWGSVAGETIFHPYGVISRGDEMQLFWGPTEVMKRATKSGGGLSAYAWAVAESMMSLPTLERYYNIHKGDIYPQYKGSALRQAFAVPSPSVQQAQNELMRTRNLKSDYKRELRERQYRSKGLLSGPAQDLIDQTKRLLEAFNN